MVRSAFLCLFLFAKLNSTGVDEFVGVRVQEKALAAAISAKDKAAILRLTAPDFRVSWSYGSVVHAVSGELSRAGWLANLVSPNLTAYAVEISDVRRAGADAAYVDLQEVLTMRLSSGRLVEKRIESVDLWRTQQDHWCLISRLSHAGRD